ncbi:MAG TPA: hypothetical protein PLU10_03620 [Chitinophagaceae bacterium]|nr:hypothetical protein [Chitinophagaceae bacterium]
MSPISTTHDFSDAFAQICRPETLHKKELDRYLHAGWFRIGQSVFTTQFLKFKTIIYNALWLRINLTSFQLSTTQQKLLKRNDRFTTEINDFSVSSELEELYQQYKTGIPFETGKNVQTILGLEHSVNIFHSKLIRVFDGNRLIGCGVFDLGEQAAAGIMTFYHPDYKKHSLGHFIILQKLLYCQQEGFQFFFPGYLVPGYKPFEYKRKLGGEHSTYFDFTVRNWLALPGQEALNMPFETMQHKLYELQVQLTLHQIECEVLHYSYFEVQLMPGFKQQQLFDYPIFLLIKIPLAIDGIFVVVYNVYTHEFNAMLCTHIWLTQQVESVPGFYSDSVLEILVYLFNEKTTDSFIQRLDPLRQT